MVPLPSAERVQVKYLSNSSVNHNNHSDQDWKPLIPKQQQPAKKAGAPAPASKLAEPKETFKPLYDRSGSVATDENFHLIYSHEKESNPSPSKPPPAKNTADEEKETPDNAHDQQALAKKIKEEARQQGFEQGKQEGYEAGMKETQAIIQNLTGILTALDGLWQEMVTRYEAEMIELVKRISEKVIYGHTQIDNEIVRRAIVKSFELIPEPTEATISVSTEDYEFIETAKEDLFEKIKSLKNVSIVSDPSLAKGGCRIETRAGEVDSDISSRLEAISSSIIEAASQAADNQ